MRVDLFPCPGCARHVRRTASACPFCGADVAEAARTAPVRRYPKERMKRAASFAFGAAALSAAGCSSTHTPGADAGLDDGADAPDGYVFAGDVAVYGGPDAPFVPPDAAADAGVPEGDASLDDAGGFDAGLDAGGSVLLYGGPPEP